MQHGSACDIAQHPAVYRMKGEYWRILIDRFLPVLCQQHIYAGDAPLMGAVLLRRALLPDAHGPQRGEEHPYHQEAATGDDQGR